MQMNGKTFTQVIAGLLFLFGSFGQASAECDIIVDKTEGCEGENFDFDVTFTRDDERDIDDISWDFGDGTTSDDRAPDKIYNDHGDYVVTVTIEFDDGTNCQTSLDDLKIFDPPTADFSVSLPGDDVVCFGDAEDGIPFSDESESGEDGAAIEDWQWDFDDGVTSEEQNPTHSYQSDGNFVPFLEVTDANGCIDQTTLDEPIEIGEPMGLDFDVDGNVTCPESDYVFENFSDIDIDDVEEFEYRTKSRDNTVVNVQRVSEGVDEWEITTLEDGEVTETEFVETPLPDIWSTFEFTYKQDGCVYPELYVRDSDGCEETLESDLEACNINYTMEPEITPTSTCFSGHEIGMSHPNRADVRDDIEESQVYAQWAINDPDAEPPVKDEPEDFWNTEFEFSSPGVYDIYYRIEEPGCVKDTVICDAVTLEGPAAQINDDDLDYKCGEVPFPYYSGKTQMCIANDEYGGEGSSNYMDQLDQFDHIFFGYFNNDEPEFDPSQAFYLYFDQDPDTAGKDFEDEGVEIDLDDVDDDAEFLEAISDEIGLDARLDGNCIEFKERGQQPRFIGIDVEGNINDDYLQNGSMPSGIYTRDEPNQNLKPPMMSWEDYEVEAFFDDQGNLIGAEDMLDILPDPYQTGFFNIFECGGEKDTLPTVFSTFQNDTIETRLRSYAVPEDEITRETIDYNPCQGDFNDEEFFELAEARPKYGQGEPYRDVIANHPINDVVPIYQEDTLFLQEDDIIQSTGNPNLFEHIRDGEIENEFFLSREDTIRLTADGDLYVGKHDPSTPVTISQDQDVDLGDFTADRKLILEYNPNYLVFDPVNRDHEVNVDTVFLRDQQDTFYLNRDKGRPDQWAAIPGPDDEDCPENMSYEMRELGMNEYQMRPANCGPPQTVDFSNLSIRFNAFESREISFESNDKLRNTGGPNGIGQNFEHIRDEDTINTFSLNDDEVIELNNGDLTLYGGRYAGKDTTFDITDNETVQFQDYSRGGREMFDSPFNLADVVGDPYFMNERDEALHPEFPHASPQMDYFWDFDDDDGNTSTEIAPTHTFEERDQGPNLFDVTLEVTDPATGCTDQTSILINLDPPDASGIELEEQNQNCVDPTGIMGEIYPYEVDLSDVIPAEPDDLWLLPDSAAHSEFHEHCADGECPTAEDSLIDRNWIDYETLEEDLEFEIGYTEPGWKTVGLVVQTGHCYDTTWQTDEFYISESELAIDREMDTLGGAVQGYEETSFDFPYNNSPSTPYCMGQRDIYPHNHFLVGDYELPKREIYDTVPVPSSGSEDYYKGIALFPNEYYDEFLAGNRDFEECVDTFSYHRLEVEWQLRLTDMRQEFITRDANGIPVEEHSPGDTIPVVLTVPTNPDKLSNFFDPGEGSAFSDDFYLIDPATGDTTDQREPLNNVVKRPFNYRDHVVQDTLTGFGWDFPAPAFYNSVMEQHDGSQLVEPINFPVTDPGGGFVEGTYDFLYGEDNDEAAARTDSTARILYPQSGIYEAGQTMQNEHDCNYTGSLDEHVGHFNHFRAVSDTIICPGEEVTFRDSVYNYRKPDPDIPDDPEINLDNESFYEEGRIHYDFTGDGRTDLVREADNLTEPVSYTYEEAGTYTVNMYTQDEGGCWMRNTQKVHVSDPQAGFDFPGDDAVCAGETAQRVDFTDQSSNEVGMHTYPNSSFELDSNQYDPWQLENYPVKVSEDSNEVAIDTVDNSIWNFDDGRGYRDDFGTLSPAYTFFENGTFEIEQIVETSAGCRDTTTQELTIEGPEPEFEIISEDTAGCAPFDVTVKDNSEDFEIREFSMGDGNIVSNPLGDEFTYTYEDAGFYEITLTASAEIQTAGGETENCNVKFPLEPDTSLADIDSDIWPPDTVTNEVTVWPKDTVDFRPEDDRLCLGDDGQVEATFINESQDFEAHQEFGYTDQEHDGFSWDFGDGNTATTDTVESVSHTYEEDTNFTVRLETRGARCPDEDSTEIQIQDVGVEIDSVNTDKMPNVYFEADAFGEDLDYNWSMGDGTTYEDVESLTHEYSEEGTYQVCVEVEDDFGCVDEDCIEIGMDPSINVPNVFSPTGDGINDKLEIMVTNEETGERGVLQGQTPMMGVLEFEMRIFNRQGRVVFETSHEDDQGIRSWNGQIDNDGNDAEAGTYYYKYEYRLMGDDETTEGDGTVNLFR